MLNLKHLGKIEAADPYLGETLRSIQTAINFHGTVAGVDPSGAVYPTPTAPSAISVTSVAGGFDVSVTDSDPQRGLVYYVEFDTLPAFPAPRTVPLFTTRNVYLPLGAATFYFRCYAQLLGSNRSEYTVFGGGNPTPVVGGAAGTPALQPTQGTGAGTSSGANPFPPVGAGYGPLVRKDALRNLPGGVP